MIDRIRESVSSVSWQLLSIIAAVAIAFAGVALWLGSNSKQIEINTTELREIKAFLNEVRQHNANTIAEQKDQDRRLNKHEQRIESLEGRHNGNK